MPYARESKFPFDRPNEFIERLLYQTEKVILGKREVVELAVLAFLCGGHVLLEDVPGVGKTMLVRTLARVFGADFKRIQCTPDLLPSDVTGVSVYRPHTGQFEFRPGPLMAGVVLVDEINRASPRTQSALLEAMEEQRVTVDGVEYPLGQPFLLLATQNPIEQEGTFVLPEAQLDRFLLKLRVGYPAERHEVELLGRLQLRHPLEEAKPVLLPEELLELQQEVRGVFVDDTLKVYLVKLAAATRSHTDLQWGASPRAVIALMRAAQARAFMAGRGYVVPDDIKSLLEPVWAHRLAVKLDARMAGRTAESVLRGIAAAVAVPATRYGAADGGAGTKVAP
ncbi:AAA family ATPase [Paenibacillus koleovorans]|uniref:AAA family ATPase n=1 Tax=Paenibacillus koleovorans TaxID=121608 RepID=UPI000FDA0821|nr:MoxR family ATPase [Paenibacillus koleovorans]